jgi:hypothetical protein
MNSTSKTKNECLWMGPDADRLQQFISLAASFRTCDFE